MAEPKTRPTDADVSAFIAALDPEQRRQDCRTLSSMMERITSAPPVLWGSVIVGFGVYTSTNSSGKPTGWPIIGFSPRKSSLTVYVTPGLEAYGTLMEGLGTYATGRSCLYVKKLADIDMTVLETLLTRSVADMKAKYPAA